MIRIILFLLLIALAAMGAVWVADQHGDVTLTLSGWRIETTPPVFALALLLLVVAAIVAWSILRALWRIPERVRHHRREHRRNRGRHAITHGLLAIGHGDATAARQHADTARRLAGNDPLSLLLHAQSAQLDGDHAGAQRAFRAMAEREDTRLLGLRGLFVEAQRADDPVAAVMVAEEALKHSPSSRWASHAVLGFRCTRGDWNGALKILDTNLQSGVIDKATFRRQRGVLLTARALAEEHANRDLSRDSAMEAVRLAPTLVPAAVLAARFESEAHQVRRAMRTVEAAWLAQPHPDLADAYVHVRLGDSALQRLARAESLAATTPGHIEGALLVARAAIDAAEFGRAREALAPFVADPTQRVAMLMAEIERTEHGDTGKARAWTLRAVRARHDPAWTADGYVSDRWRPVSPVTGRLDAFQWQTPVASLPSDKARTIDAAPLEEAMLEPPADKDAEKDAGEPAAEAPPMVPADPNGSATEEATAARDNSPQSDEPAKTGPAVPFALPGPTAQAAPLGSAALPLFRSRADLASPAAPVPPVLPIVRPPDDPGVDEGARTDEFSEQMGQGAAQQGGWRGFWSRWVG